MQHFHGQGWGWAPYQLWLVPLMIVLMWMPFTPPPTKNVMALQKPPVLKPADDPFDNIQIMPWKKMKRAAEAALPRDAQKHPLILFRQVQVDPGSQHASGK